MHEKRATVYVIDDDLSVRASIERLFRSIGHSVRTFEAAGSFLAASGVERPGCLIVDVRLPHVSGLEFQRELVKQGNGMPIVFVTGHGDIPMSVAAMKAGAIEFLTKPFRDQDLIDAVHRGIELDHARIESARSLKEARQRLSLLTAREREVMTEVVAGLMNKQIAGKLELSEVTVKVHRSQMMRKLGVRTLPELVRLADRAG